MLIITPCPKCGRSIRVADQYLGTRVRCPQCNAVFVVEDADVGPAAAARLVPAAELRKAPPRAGDETGSPRRRRRPRADDEDEEDRPHRRRGGRPGEWARVRTGLTLVLASLGLGALCSLFCGGSLLAFGGGAIGVAGALSGNKDAGDRAMAAFGTGMVLLAFGACTGLISHGLSIAGHVFCIFAPPRHGAKILAVVALVLACLGLLLTCGSGYVNTPSPNSDQYQSASPPTPAPVGPHGVLPLFGVQYVCDFAEKVVFLFFLRAVALGVKRDGLASGVVIQLIATGLGTVLSTALICGGVLLSGGFLYTVLSSKDPKAALGNAGAGYAVAAAVLAGLFVLTWVVLWVWYVVTLFRARSALTAHLEARP
jgi:predicted Zn finger-like uncharacterized protein